MNDVRKLGTLAVVFLVVLRIGTGWQLLYEGLWKLNTYSSTTPWTAEGYLKNAQGPLRNSFHRIAGGGPYDLHWLDYKRVAGRWSGWQKRFLSHYPGLSDRQKTRLEEIVNGSKEYYADLSALPEGVDLSDLSVISYDEKRKRLVVDGRKHLIPRERESLYRMVPDVEKEDGELTGGTELEREFYDAVTKVYDRQSRLGFKEKLAASLKGDAERVGSIYAAGPKTYGEIDEYRAMVTEHEKDLLNRTTDFNQVHIDYTKGEINKQKAKVVNPVKALEAEMKLEARNLLSPRQMAAGSIPPRLTPLTVSNYLTIAGLLILGTFLMLGFLTRTSAAVAAFMVFSFYLVTPPWPGVPPAPGPDHSLFVNKNLIEVMGLLAIACTHSGLWFGVDGLFRKMLNRRKAKKGSAPAKPGKGPVQIKAAE